MAQGENHTDVVAQVKAECQAAGVLPAGPEGAFNIISNVAWRLRGERAGLLSKPSGNNWQGFATDIICYPDGHIYDVLGDGGGANNPQWSDAGMDGVGRYVAAFDPDNLDDGPIDPPVDPPSDATAEIIRLLTSIDANIAKIAG